MRVIFTAHARTELTEAKRYYNQQQTGLGDRFQQDAEVCAGRILEYPHAWQIERGSIRRLAFSSFPYKMLYAIEDERIVVVAVAHQHRAPDYWIDRIGAQ